MLCVQILDLKFSQTPRLRLTLLPELHGCFSPASGVPLLMYLSCNAIHTDWFLPRRVFLSVDGAL